MSSYKKPPHMYRHKRLLWLRGIRGERYPVELDEPPTRDEEGRLAFRVTEGEKVGTVVHLEDRLVCVDGKYSAENCWGVV